MACFLTGCRKCCLEEREIGLREQVRQAIARALGNEDREYAETRWSDALSTAGSCPSWGVVRCGTRLVDFWRVEAFEPDWRLRLVAEMQLPGRAWLEFEVEGDATTSQIRQTAIVDPVGLWGQHYWYALYPLHSLIFAGMLRHLARASTGTAVSWAALQARGAA